MLESVQKTTRGQIKDLKIGLVLEGGGFRGIYTAGVLDVFMDNGLAFDGVIGVSAGVIHGCSFLSGQKGRSIRYYKKYCGDPRFMSFKSWLKTGNVVGVDFCYRELPEELDKYDYKAFSENKTPFYAVCSNVESGEADLIRITDMKEQINFVRASASLPYFSKIVEIEEKKYLDGGVTDSIPVKLFREKGYARNVVVMTRTADYRKEKGNSFTSRLFYRKYPKFASALSNRYLMYNQEKDFIANLESKGEVFCIQPKFTPEIGRLEADPEKIQRVYDMGRSDATEAMESLVKWLAEQRVKS